jgi:hypothetical protein
MYPGHFAAGLALKTIEPKTPTWGLMIAVGFLDLLFGAFVAFQIEGGNINHLDIPWSHSLVMSLLWSLLFASLFVRWGWRVVGVMFVAVMSHWVLDLISHHPDMSLWPYSTTELGFYQYSGGLAGWFEASFCVASTVWYVTSAQKSRLYGGHWIFVCVSIAAMYVVEYLFVP